MAAVTNKKSVKDFNKHSQWMCDVVLEQNPKDLKYYLDAKQDLSMILLVYRGVRLQDIKDVFYLNSEYNLDLKRIKMDSWITFLISCSSIIEFKRDTHKDEVYLFASEELLRNQLDKLMHIQLMINATPKDPKDGLNFRNLVKMSAIEVFNHGYMSLADSPDISMQDPRAPKQNMGVAAKAKDTTSSAAGSQKRKNHYKAKKSFYQQIADKPSKPTVTTESTAPLAETQTGSILSWFDAI